MANFQAVLTEYITRVIDLDINQNPNPNRIPIWSSMLYYLMDDLKDEVGLKSTGGSSLSPNDLSILPRVIRSIQNHTLNLSDMVISEDVNNLSQDIKEKIEDKFNLLLNDNYPRKFLDTEDKQKTFLYIYISKKLILWLKNKDDHSAKLKHFIDDLRDILNIYIAGELDNISNASRIIYNNIEDTMDVIDYLDNLDDTVEIEQLIL